MKISVVGLGKLGSPLAAVAASKGHTVVGADLNEGFVRAINEGRPPVEEPGLAERIAANRERLSATTDVRRAVLETDVTFLIVPTPSGPDGRFSTKYVLSAAGPVAAALREKSGYHVVSLTSTVMPGATGGELLPALERGSGRRCGPDFGLCYNPEFIALGNVIDGMLKPDFLLIGESDRRSGDVLMSFYESVCENRPAAARMNFVNAELTKISVNTFVTTKISYANMLAEVCETLPGADVETVTAALGMDTRIGRKYLRGALGYGGPCFPRDNVAFASLARGNGVPPLLAEATDHINHRQVERLAARVLSLLAPDGRVGILGLAYKPDTPVVEESQGLQLAGRLADESVRVTVYDPLAMPAARAILGDRVTWAGSVAECAGRADVLAITTGWPEFRSLTPQMLDARRGRPAVIDCWRLLSPEVFAPACRYVTVGTGPAA